MYIKLRVLKDKEPKDEKESKKPKLNLSNQVQILFLTKTDADFSTLYLKLEYNIKAEIDKNKLRACKDYSFITTSYKRIKSRQLTQLLDFLQKNQCKYGDFNNM